MRRRGQPVVIAILAAVIAIPAALLLSACGSSGDTATTVSLTGSPHRQSQSQVRIYSGLVDQGPSPAAVAGRAIERGITLAVDEAGHRAGSFYVHYVSLADSTAGGALSNALVQSNARHVAIDPDAIAYIGDLESQASELSAPILNEAGITQISPGSTYVGLTDSVSQVTPASEPERYFPTGIRTFLRLVASDAIQMQAQAQLMKQQSCGAVGVLRERGSYDTGLATMLVAAAKQVGLTVAIDSVVPSRTGPTRSLAETLHGQSVGCLALLASPSPVVTALTVGLHMQFPKARILGSARLCQDSWTNPADGGVPATVAAALECTRPVLGFSALPGAAAFVADYRRHYRRAPESVYSLYGYEAAELVLSAIGGLGRDGDNRARINRVLFGTHDRSSGIGTYGFDGNGDTTLSEYGLYTVDHAGSPAFASVIRVSP